MSGISQRIRFEVFKRDMFTCQYCGMKAPNVVLHVDHITPRSLGGSDDILNLVTACKDCNGGKSDKPLSSHGEMEARRARMTELEERRQQLQLMRDWHVSLASLDKQSAAMLWDVWCELSGVPQAISDEAQTTLIQLLKKYSFDEVASGMREACKKYIAPSSDSTPNGGGVAFSHVAKCCRIARIMATDPVDGRKRYVIGILKNRVSYLNTRTAALLIDEGLCSGVSIEYMEEAAKRAVSWSDFRSTVEDAIEVVSNQYTDVGEQ